MFRKAEPRDLDAIAAIYDRIHDNEEAGKTTIGWIRSIYPTRATAQSSIEIGDMYVEEVDGVVVAAAKINQEQVPEYANAQWQWEAPDEKILVLHTLVVDPEKGRGGYGKAFVAFYEDMARNTGCPYLRMDTNVRNVIARQLYKGLGYAEVGIVDCQFNGIPGVQLVCLEKKVN
jgi:GNAT superfamily N-acetyltransferase